MELQALLGALAIGAVAGLVRRRPSTYGHWRAFLGVLRYWIARLVLIAAPAAAAFLGWVIFFKAGWSPSDIDGLDGALAGLLGVLGVEATSLHQILNRLEAWVIANLKYHTERAVTEWLALQGATCLKDLVREFGVEFTARLPDHTTQVLYNNLAQAVAGLPYRDSKKTLEGFLRKMIIANETIPASVSCAPTSRFKTKRAYKQQRSAVGRA